MSIEPESRWFASVESNVHGPYIFFEKQWNQRWGYIFPNYSPLKSSLIYFFIRKNEMKFINLRM